MPVRERRTLIRRTPVRANRTLISVLAAVALAIAGGCGHAKTLSGDRTLYVALTDYRVTPQSVHVSAGALTILVHNYGRLTHDLVVSLDGQPAGSTTPIRPGQGAEMTLALLPGTYLMASTILSDQALGQYGTLKVTS